MSDDFDLDEFLKNYDPIAESIKLAESDPDSEGIDDPEILKERKKLKKEATRWLLELAAAHLSDTSNAPHKDVEVEPGLTFRIPTGSGPIPDRRLSDWLVDYLEQRVKTLRPRGRKAKRNLGPRELAIRVQIYRSDPEELAENREYQDWFEELGMTKEGAIRRVSEDTGIKASTIRRHYESERRNAIQWIKDKGPRIPRNL
jgi:hypothetical protein